MRIALVARLRMFKGDRVKTAVSLGVGRTTVYRWIRDWSVADQETEQAKTGPKRRPLSELSEAYVAKVLRQGDSREA